MCQFDAVFIAIGAQIGRSLAMQIEDFGPILEATEYLNLVGNNQAPQLDLELSCSRWR